MLSPDAFMSFALHQGLPLPSRFRSSILCPLVVDGLQEAPWRRRPASSRSGSSGTPYVMLAKAKELAKIGYNPCPRHINDKQFWTIYFLLVRSYILPEVSEFVRPFPARFASVCAIPKSKFASLHTGLLGTSEFAACVDLHEKQALQIDATSPTKCTDDTSLLP